MKAQLRRAANRLGYEIQSLHGPHRVATMATFWTWFDGQDIEIATVLDVGASDGRWARESLRVLPSARHVLFEPQPAHDDGLRAFLADHPSASLVRSAVGDRVGTARFDASDAFGGGLADEETAPAQQTDIEVPVTTLDQSVIDLDLTGPYLVKLDTHGFEAGILAGAEHVLSQANVLIIEAYNHRLTSEGLYFWELCGLLHERGFRPIDLVDVMHRERDGSLWQMDIIFVRSTWPGFDSNDYR